MPKVKVFCLFYISKIDQTEAYSEIPLRAGLALVHFTRHILDHF
jgi:hypothetical protein